MPNKMVSMKSDPAATKSTPDPAGMPAEPQFPWGLRINLDNDALLKLGIKKLPAVGGKLMIEAAVTIVTVNEQQVQGGEPRRSLELQITDLCLGDTDDKGDDKGEGKADKGPKAIKTDKMYPSMDKK